MSEIYTDADGYVSVPQNPDLVQFRSRGELQEPELIQFALLQQAEISNRTLQTIKSGVIFFVVVQSLAIIGYVFLAARVYKILHP